MSFFTTSQTPAWRRHCCGIYYNHYTQNQVEKLYLPQVELQAHTTILSTTSRTILTQTFVNPSDEKGIKEVRYTFPLYDGVSIVGFTCHVGDRVIVGEVKEKEKARTVFNEAVARGETAGLFEQLPEAADVFTTTVGNVPPASKVLIKITYLGELKHDMEVDGIRFTIPNIICPRYGEYPRDFTSNAATKAAGNGISITVDAEMAQGSFIQQIRSPSHPIAVSMGTTSFAPNAEPSMTRASATLSLGSAQLDTDFVLQIIAKDTGIPKAILETHPTIPNHRALMATLVPKFSLPADKPEIVFVCDRSGSMSGSNITLVVQALKIFLKSLPVGTNFNICSFGSSYSFLWPKSVTYSQRTLDEAVRHVENFTANFGGTEMYQPLKATIEQRYKDIPLEIMLLTDGEIWEQQTLFTYLNREVSETKAPIRVFTLGIGNGVSHSLIEGIAKAGDGFSQTVGQGEKMDTKVVRMLKGALSPHVKDYTLEVKYSDKTSSMTTDDEDFEIIEKVTDSLNVNLDLDDKPKKGKQEPVGYQSKTMRAFFADYHQKKTISLFDPAVDLDKDEPPVYDETGESRYAHLPTIPVPKIIQAPQNIPSLFAFNRTTVYLLLGPDAPRLTPKSVVLRGTSVHGPLELEIPVQVLDTPGETIHQLAAKKAIAELEQGRGWLPEAKDVGSGTLVKLNYESRFSDMVEREAVRLGVQFQVGGKWCSFVAVEKNKKNQGKGKDGYEWLDAPPTVKNKSAPKGVNKREHIDSLGAYIEEEMDEDEDEDEDAEVMHGAARRLRALGRAMSKEVDTQNAHINRIISKTDKVDDSIVLNRSRLARIDGVRETKKSSPAVFGGGGSGSALFGNSSVQSLPTTSGLKFDRLQQTPSSNAPGPQHNPVFGSMNASPYVQNSGSTSRSAASIPQMQSMSAASPLADVGGSLDNFDFDSFLHNDQSAPTFGSSQPPHSQITEAKKLQEYQMELMQLEQQNTKRMLMSRQDGNPLPPPPPPPPSAPGSLFMPAPPRPMAAAPPSAPFDAGFGGAMPSFRFRRAQAAPPAPKPQKPKTEDEILDALVALQTFEGYWDWNSEFISVLSLSSEAVKRVNEEQGVDIKMIATALAVAFLETKLASLSGSWELVVEKARGWLGGRGDEFVEKAKVLL